MASIPEVNGLDRDAFVALLGGVFEHSPWVAEGAWAQRPFGNVDDLHRAMVAVAGAAPEAARLTLLQAHPDLAGKLARGGGLTAASTAEQASAGLDRLADDEYDEFTALNDAYKARFGFPFIIAVRENTKATILDAFKRRLNHDRPAEFAAALAEVAKIARFRLDGIFGG